jgi:DNA-binding response OmpR family regulator
VSARSGFLAAGLDLLHGMAAANVWSFAGLLLDIHLPDGNGLDLLRAIRESSELTSHRKLPVVIMTTSGDAKDYEDALWLGTIAYVRKPLDLTELQNAVRTALV